MRFDATPLSLSTIKTAFENDISMSYRLLLSMPVWVRFAAALVFLASIPVEQWWGFHYDTTGLRLVVTCFIVFMSLQSFWPRILLGKEPYIWFIFVTVLFPFCFSGIVLGNAAATPSKSPLQVLPLAEYSLALLFMIQFLRTMRLTVLSWLIGTLASLLVPYFLVDDPNTDMIQQNFFYMVPFVVTLFLIGGITNNALFNFQREKEEAIWRIASSLAHQLRTPLATIQNMVRGTEENYEALINGYDAAAQHRLIENPIADSKKETLREALKIVDDEAENAKTLIDILLSNTKPFHIPAIQKSNLSIDLLVNKAVETYPYNNPREQALIILDLAPFEVYGNETMVLHMFYNLIANSVEFAQKRPSGSVLISSIVNTEYNEVFVRDTGPGIPPHHLSRVFEPFFSFNSMSGTGIGLSFCKSVVEGMGGSISVDSKENEYTEFRLQFPKIA